MCDLRGMQRLSEREEKKQDVIAMLQVNGVTPYGSVRKKLHAIRVNF